MAYTRHAVTGIINENKFASTHALLGHYSAAGYCSLAMQPQQRVASHYTTDPSPLIATHPRAANSSSPPFTVFVLFVLFSYPSLLFAFPRRRHLLLSVYFFVCTVLASPAFIPCHLSPRMRQLHFLCARPWGSAWQVTGAF